MKIVYNKCLAISESQTKGTQMRARNHIFEVRVKRLDIQKKKKQILRNFRIIYESKNKSYFHNIMHKFHSKKETISQTLKCVLYLTEN